MLTPESTYVRPNGSWECRVCVRLSRERRRDRIREQEAARRSGGARLAYQAGWARGAYERAMSEPDSRWRERKRRIDWSLANKQRKIAERVAAQPTTPLGDLVRCEINRIGDRVGTL